MPHVADCICSPHLARRSKTLSGTRRRDWRSMLVPLVLTHACATTRATRRTDLIVEFQQENAVKLYPPAAGDSREFGLPAGDAGAIYDCQRGCIKTDARLRLRNVLPVLPDIGPPDQRRIERRLIVTSIGGKELNRGLWVALDPRLTVSLKPARELGSRHCDLYPYA
jgi:hypothetical protein